MTLQTITIKFVEKGPQSRRKRRLEQFCARLVEEGSATKTNVRAVFPGDRDPEMASLFTIEAVGTATDLSQRFQELQDIEFAERAAPRRILLRTA